MEPVREKYHKRRVGEIMRVLGKNMALLMKLVENGKGMVASPEREAKIYMNYIH